MRGRHFLALAPMLAGCTSEQPLPATVGQPAPAYAAPTVAGDTVRIADLRGSVVLLNVWATWCVPCRKEMPELQALHSEYGSRGLRVIGVSVDEAGSDEVVTQFTQDLGITYTILRDPGENINDAYSVIGVPSSFLIDREGRIAWRYLGPFSKNDTSLVRALRATL